jgi:hypothetical protein
LRPQAAPSFWARRGSYTCSRGHLACGVRSRAVAAGEPSTVVRAVATSMVSSLLAYSCRPPAAAYYGGRTACTAHSQRQPAGSGQPALQSTLVHRMAHTSRVIPPAQLILQISHISLERRRPAAFAAAARHTAALCEHQRSSTAAPRLAARATALLPSRSRAPSARTPDHLLPPPTRPRGPTRPQVPQHHAAHVSDVAANERREGRRHGLRRRR